MLDVTKTNDLSFYNDQGILSLSAKQYDTGRKFVFNIVNDYELCDLTGYSVYFRMLKADNTQFQGEECCTIEGSQITIDPSVGNGDQILSCAGKNICEIHLTDSEGKGLTTWNFVINVAPRVYDGSLVDSTDSYDTLDKVTQDIITLKSDLSNHTTTIASSNVLGHIKSGTDITIDVNGNVSVNDNSHKHTVSNISDLTATASELNTLDGITSTTAELNKLHGTDATVDDFNKLHDVTASSSELNVLDGMTATTTELNYVDGVTSNIQTQLNSKQTNITGAASSIANDNLTTSRALISDSDGKVAVSDITSTELGYLDGVTSKVQTQLNAKAPLASPTLTGTPKAPTATAGTNTTQIATTAFVQTAVSNLVDSAPETLNTLNELSAALGDDPNFATTVATQIGNIESDVEDIVDGTTTIAKATSAIKLATARIIRTNLGSTSTASFDGTANITPGVTGTLPVANGGTGATTTKYAQYNLLNDMNKVDTEVSDTSHFVGAYITPSTNDGAVYKRTGLSLWNYIKSKISTVLGLTETNYKGTANQAMSDANGDNIANTYATKESVNNKVDKEEGKGLSSNDFTDEHLSIVETMSTGNITGIKGDAETEYRTGNVNLTAENIGAVPNYKYTIDLSDSAYDENTWYPVVGEPLPDGGFRRIKVEVYLNSGTNPSWSTHERGFSCITDLLVTPHGWGTIMGRAICLNYDCMWTDSVNPVGFNQLTKSSRPVLYLRGGGKYFMYTDYSTEFTPYLAEMSFEETEETVTSVTECPGISIEKSTIHANLEGGATKDGKGNVITDVYATKQALIDNFNNADHWGNGVFGSGDVNTWCKPGIYSSIGGQTSNLPTISDGWATLVVIRSNHVQDRLTQICWNWNNAAETLYKRVSNNNGTDWSNWVAIIDSDNYKNHIKSVNSIIDYNDASNPIQVGWRNAGLTVDNFKGFAGYTCDDNIRNVKIKDVSTDVAKSILGIAGIEFQIVNGELQYKYDTEVWG